MATARALAERLARSLGGEIRPFNVGGERVTGYRLHVGRRHSGIQFQRLDRRSVGPLGPGVTPIGPRLPVDVWCRSAEMAIAAVGSAAWVRPSAVWRASLAASRAVVRSHDGSVVSAPIAPSRPLRDVVGGV